eukprot:6157936-Prymnesium_polylepis.1
MASPQQHEPRTRLEAIVGLVVAAARARATPRGSAAPLRPLGDPYTPVGASAKGFRKSGLLALMQEPCKVCEGEGVAMAIHAVRLVVGRECDKLRLRHTPL